METLTNIESIVGIVSAVLGLPTVIGGSVAVVKHIQKKKKGELPVPNPEISNPGLSTKPVDERITINVPISYVKKKENSSARKITLSNNYTSLYAENGKLQKEVIILDDVGEDGKITGKIKLVTSSKKEEYLLSATFFNKVINGVYYASDNSKDECGTINIKQVSEDVYSGVCTFSKLATDGTEIIKSSPYVWVKGNDEDLLNGTYKFCENCAIETEMCCCASNRVDMPVLLYNEASNLRDKQPYSWKYKLNTFAEKIENSPIYKMKHNLDTKTEEPEHCFFYDYQDKKCLVYDIRPLDCRLFPFDIRLNNTQRDGQPAPDNEYWIGYYPSLCCKKLPTKEEMEKQIAILRPYFYILAPFVDSYTRNDIFPRLDNEEFEMLYRLRDIIY